MKTILLTMSALAVSAGLASAERAPTLTIPLDRLAAPTSVEDAADSLFQLGREAISDGKYERAITLLRQVVDKYPQSQKAGDALYWRAWASYHLGLDRHNKEYLDAALSAIDKLQANYPKATSISDARDLRTQIRTAQASLGDSQAAGDIAAEAKGLQSRACSAGDDEMRMAALQGLMSMNSSDAVPILKEVLAQRDPCKVRLRKQAVYIIAQQRTADVVSSLLEVARNDPSPEVQADAVYWLSTTHSDRAAAALDSILFQGRDDDLRGKAVYALSQVGTDRAAQALRRAAQDDKLPASIRGNAIYWLGNAKLADLEFFRTLYKADQSRNVRAQIIQAVVGLRSPQGTQWLLDMARDKNLDAESRKNAIYWVSQQPSVDMDQLNAIYEQARGENSVQTQVLYVYSLRKESAAVDKLMAIAKSDPNIEMRKQALYWLGTKNDPRIQQFIRDLIMK